MIGVMYVLTVLWTPPSLVVSEYTSYLMLLYLLTYLLVLNNLHHKYTGNFIIDPLNKKSYLYLFKTIHNELRT